MVGGRGLGRLMEGGGGVEGIKQQEPARCQAGIDQHFAAGACFICPRPGANPWAVVAAAAETSGTCSPR